MVEENGLPELGSGEAESDTSHSGREFPSQPFACPACGQLLGPAVRVCVACKQPINPAEINQPVPAVAAPGAGVAVPSVARVPFPGQLFLILLAARLLAAFVVVKHWSPPRAALALGGLDIVSAAWVFHDARERGVPKPLRWGLGSLLLWTFIFPWYLVRRRAPQASCPFVEAEVGPVTRALLFVLVLLLLLGIVAAVLQGPSGK
jgi:hypothetical protein